MSAGVVLSEEAIAALVDAAKDGRLPDEPAGQQRRAKRVRTVDFTRPTKFTSDQERKFRRSLDAFCRTASQRLSAELRAPLELEVINSTQLTWANAHGQVPTPSVTALLQTRPHETRMLLSAETSLVLCAIELLLGGSAVDEVGDRRLTDIDWALASHFFGRMAAQLSIIWADQADLELEIAGLDQHLETAQAALVSEPTLSLTIEARLGGRSSTLSLLIPYEAIAPVAHRFSTHEDLHGAGAPGQDAAVREAVGSVAMTVRAEVGAVELPIEQVLALRAGDIVRLGPAGAITLFTDEVPVQLARPGRNGSRRAVQVLGPARGAA